MRALALGCFYSHISTRTVRRALTASLDSCAEIKSALSVVVTKSGRVWRKVPESRAWSVVYTLIPTPALDSDTQILMCTLGHPDRDVYTVTSTPALDRDVSTLTPRS